MTNLYALTKKMHNHIRKAIQALDEQGLRNKSNVYELKAAHVGGCQIFHDKWTPPGYAWCNCDPDIELIQREDKPLNYGEKGPADNCVRKLLSYIDAQGLGGKGDYDATIFHEEPCARRKGGCYCDCDPAIFICWREDKPI